MTIAAIAVAVVSPVKHESQDCGRQNRFTKHHQFEGFDERVGCDLDEVGVCSCPERRNHFSQLMVMRQYGDTRERILLLEKFNLCNGRVEFIADIDNEQDGLRLGRRRQDDIVNTTSRPEDAKIGSTQNTRKALSE